MFKDHMKKKFIVAGEVSGDRTAAWYINKRMLNDSFCSWEGLGGDFMQGEGVVLWARFEELNLTGVIEIVRHLPRILNLMTRLIDYIVIQKIDEVVLVDFPGFNVRLAKRLKKRLPNITITYVAPPQMWCWGAWRIKKIKKLFDIIIVLYPFEVLWYAKMGLRVECLGCPVYDALLPYTYAAHKKESIIALIPGSRNSEVMRYLPLLVSVALQLYKKYPHVRFVLPIAQTFSENFIWQQLHICGIAQENFPITVVRVEGEKFELLRKCCLAITKPGTVTLECALLKVPAVVFLKVSWITYLLARCVIKVHYLALPNLLLNKVVYPECIQSYCTVERIIGFADSVLYSYFNDKSCYQELEEQLAPLHKILQMQ
jgi:lipid-A-disaccharide synthase